MLCEVVVVVKVFEVVVENVSVVECEVEMLCKVIWFVIEDVVL